MGPTLRKSGSARTTILSQQDDHACWIEGRKRNRDARGRAAAKPPALPRTRSAAGWWQGRIAGRSAAESRPTQAGCSQPAGTQARHAADLVPGMEMQQQPAPHRARRTPKQKRPPAPVNRCRHAGLSAQCLIGDAADQHRLADRRERDATIVERRARPWLHGVAVAPDRRLRRRWTRALAIGVFGDVEPSGQ